MLLEKKEVEKVNRTAFKDRVGELKKTEICFSGLPCFLPGRRYISHILFRRQ
ncbi:Uncharacterised protein [Escherichia coli]|nr:Uncharacterised protein [Escherichia coli]